MLMTLSDLAKFPTTWSVAWPKLQQLSFFNFVWKI